MKTAISLPDELYRAGEQAAERLGVSRSELYRIALRYFLQGHDHKLTTEALDEVYGEEPARVDPEVLRMQMLSLPKEDW